MNRNSLAEHTTSDTTHTRLTSHVIASRSAMLTDEILSTSNHVISMWIHHISQFLMVQIRFWWEPKNADEGTGCAWLTDGDDRKNWPRTSKKISLSNPMLDTYQSLKKTSPLSLFWHKTLSRKLFGYHYRSRLLSDSKIPVTETTWKMNCQIKDVDGEIKQSSQMTNGVLVTTAVE